MEVHITGDAAADQILSDDPFALLVGMMLDQQYPMEHAFRGPAKIRDRFGSLDPAAIAAADAEEFAQLCSQTPAIHRFPGSMSGRVQELARVVVERYDGDAAGVWTHVETGRDLLGRLQELPGFGQQKARIFLALLAKQLEVCPPGWQEAVGDYAEPGFRSVADVRDPESLRQVREFKKQQKAAARADR